MTEHDGFRQALLEGETNAAVDEHLATCAECRRLAATLARIEATAPMIDVPAAPAGLADRVLARVAAESAGPATRESSPPAAPAPDRGRPADDVVVPIRRGMRRSLLAAGIAAAVLASVITTSVVLRDDGEAPRQAGPPPSDDPQEILNIVADNTAALESARVDLDATLNVEVAGLLGGSGTYVVDGTGEIAFPDALHLEYTLSTTDDTDPLLAIEPETNETLSIGDEFWSRSEGEPWDPGDSEGGTALTRTLFDPAATVEVLRSADGEPVDLGIDEIDGERVHGYRFTVPVELFPIWFPPSDPPGNDWTVVAYVTESDQVLRRLTVSGTGETVLDGIDVSWNSELTIGYHDIGADVSIEPPAPEDISG